MTPRRQRSPRQERRLQMSVRLQHLACTERSTRLVESGVVPAAIWDDIDGLRQELELVRQRLSALGPVPRERSDRRRLGYLLEVIERRLAELKEPPGVAVSHVPEVEVYTVRSRR